MTLTVRLDESLAAALAEHCAASGTTKSQVVQCSLAAYLMREGAAVASARTKVRGRAARPSAVFSAFEQAGLLGGTDLGATSADKAEVRRRVGSA